MKRTDSELRSVYRAATTREPGGEATCPTSQEIAESMMPDGKGREAVVQHAARCSACAEALAALMPLEGLVKATIGSPVRPEATILSFPTLYRAAPLLAAASLFLAIGIAVTLWERSPKELEGGSVVRGGDSTVASANPADDSRLATPPRSFSWAPHPSADGYRVEVLDSESTLLWTSPLVRVPQVDVPANVLARLTEGKFFWRVVSLDGVRETRSRLSRFSVAR